MNHSSRGTRLLENIAMLLLLSMRGLLLWVLIPFAFLAWLFVHCWAHRASLRHAVAWYDMNMSVLLINGPLRFMIPTANRPRVVGISRMGEGSHRVHLTDLW